MGRTYSKLMHCLIFLALVAVQPDAVSASNSCGEVVTVAAHAGTTMQYAYAPAVGAAASPARTTLVMLVGGGGYINLDEKGCPQLLSRNSLIRMSPLLRDAGIAIALVDAPSDLRSDEGLGGFRVATEHANDLGAVIADVRARTHGAVWIAGHSRGTISAANAAGRLTGLSAPDGLVLMSAITVGDVKARKFWVAHTVFSVDLEAIKSPVLVIGHVADSCVRSPAGLMNNIIAKTHGSREQVVAVTGGPISPGRSPDVATCEPREPHDFVDQEVEVAAGIVRFIRGGSY